MEMVYIFLNNIFWSESLEKFSDIILNKHCEYSVYISWENFRQYSQYWSGIYLTLKCRVF